MEFSQFRKYEQKLFHTITDRYGGVSQKPYDTLNLALHVADEPLNVLENRLRVSEKYDFCIKNLIYMDQVHGAHVAVIEDAMENKISECDAMITNQRNIPLMVMVADCIPILLYDPVQEVIGVAHAGRNGTFLGIVQETVKKMQQHFHVLPKDILIGLGPSIHRCCYEVGSDLADIAIKNFGEASIMIKEGRSYLDLQLLNYHQMIEIGIQKEHIETSSICTACDENYFSYRREGETGRFAGFMMLR
jgi:YfiH family protein